MRTVSLWRWENAPCHLASVLMDAKGLFQPAKVMNSESSLSSYNLILSWPGEMTIYGQNVSTDAAASLLL